MSSVSAHKLDFIIALYIFCIAVAELLGGKTFALLHWGTFHLNASVAIFVIPILFSITDVVTEVCGVARSRNIVRTGFVTIAAIALFSVLAVSLPPSARFVTMEPAYDAVFSTSIRISLASLTAFAIAEWLDVVIFARLRARLGHSRLWLRNNLSNIISQLFDTTIFITLAFYAMDQSMGENIPFLMSIILPYWLLKCGMSIIETPLVYLGVWWLRKEHA